MGSGFSWLSKVLCLLRGAHLLNNSADSYMTNLLSHSEFTNTTQKEHVECAIFCLEMDSLHP